MPRAAASIVKGLLAFTLGAVCLQLVLLLAGHRKDAGAVTEEPSAPNAAARLEKLERDVAQASAGLGRLAAAGARTELARPPATAETSELRPRFHSREPGTTDDRVFEKERQTLNGIFEQQPRDATWAAATETRLKASLGSSFPHDIVKGAVCHHTMCKLIVQHTDRAAGELFRRDSPRSIDSVAALRYSIPDIENAPNTTELLVFREGHPIPGRESMSEAAPRQHATR